MTALRCQKQQKDATSRKNRAMSIPIKQEQRVTFRLPADLHQQLLDIAARDVITLNAVVVSRLQSASVLDRLDQQDREIAELKSMLRELLDKT